jgi:hypothetical protein
MAAAPSSAELSSLLAGLALPEPPRSPVVEHSEARAHTQRLSRDGRTFF